MRSLLITLLLLSTAACAPEPAVTAELTGCLEDADCLAHEVCVQGSCLPADAILEDEAPSADPAPEEKEQAQGELPADAEAPEPEAPAEPEAPPPEEEEERAEPVVEEPAPEEEPVDEPIMEDAGTPAEDPVDPVQPDPAPADEVPGAWTCEAGYYGDGECDCGCGVVDADCSADTADVCQWDLCPLDERPVDDANWLCEINDATCANRCGAAAPGGCYCDYDCQLNGDCCPDYNNFCGF